MQALHGGYSLLPNAACSRPCETVLISVIFSFRGRMGNMRGWGGPLPYPTWYQSQLALQHKILKRMRDFGMIPVLPGFAGHVPAAIKTLYPTANVLRLGDWGGFNSTYCCTYFLDPNDSLFQVRILFIVIFAL